MTPSSNKSQNVLNVHAVLPVSYANGPGARAVVWTQGCDLDCPGCGNPQTHSHSPRILVDPGELADYILSLPHIEGLTVSGGEPFEQAAAVGRLCRMVRKEGLSVMVFTGWTYADIFRSHNPAVRNLLRQIDLLVDGPFVRRLADKDLLWRGSSNQQIRLLTNRYGPDVLRTNRQPRVEGQLMSGATLHITGFPDESDVAMLAERLAAETGILLETIDTTKNQDAERGV